MLHVLIGVKPYREANHAPSVRVKQALDLDVKPEQTLKLNAVAKDPDGNKVSFKWWQYQEARSYQGRLDIPYSKKAEVSFIVPTDAKRGNTIHLILQVTDDAKEIF